MFLKKSLKTLFTLLLLLAVIPATTTSCGTGFGVYSFDADSTYIEIISEDSVKHYYKETLKIGTDMWCFEHSKWEIVRKK